LKPYQLGGEATEVRHPANVLKVHLALLLPTFGRYSIQFSAIHWLNDDILLGIFNYYQVDAEDWNDRLWWCRLSHVCQRWRHLIHECAFHLGMHIECTDDSPIVDTLDHLPPLPLHLNYGQRYATIITEQDELGICHALRLHNRVRHISIILSPSIFLKVHARMDQHFPMLEHLSLSFAAKNSTPFTLPTAFLAPKLRHLALPGISPPKRLQVLTSMVSLVTLNLSNIKTSSYFRPRLLVARLRSLPQLEELYIRFSMPIPRPSAEREMLGEHRAPVTLPSLKYLQFKGISPYLESLVAQIRVPLLEWLDITLFNQIAFALPHLSRLVNITERFKALKATVYFSDYDVSITTTRDPGAHWIEKPFRVHVVCKQLDWQIDCAAQICHALIPALSGVEKFRLNCDREIPTELQNGAIDSTTWHDLLSSLIRVKELYIEDELAEELSRALLVDEVGSDPGFLPNLLSIYAAHNLFTAFIDARRVVGRPVEFVEW
jgi:hypothetical protein